jgi:hypothetical protein
MNELRNRRVKALEAMLKPPEPIEITVIKFLWVKDGKTPEQTFQESGFPESDRNRVVYVGWEPGSEVKEGGPVEPIQGNIGPKLFQDDTEAGPPARPPEPGNALLSLDEEIDQVILDMKREGLSWEEIRQAVAPKKEEEVMSMGDEINRLLGVKRARYDVNKG